MPDHTVNAVRASSAGNAFSAMFGMAADMVRKVKREIEIERATRALHALPDHMLKDMGIDRYEIDQAARFGRREYGRRYL